MTNGRSGERVPLNVDSAGAAGGHGQILDWTFDLTTAPWINAHLDIAVTHTDHMFRRRPIFYFYKTSKDKTPDPFGIRSTEILAFSVGELGFTLLFYRHPYRPSYS